MVANAKSTCPWQSRESRYRFVVSRLPLDVHLLRAAQLSLEGGDAAGALTAINRMSGNPLGVATQKTHLLVEIYRTLGNRAGQESVLRSNLGETRCYLPPPFLSETPFSRRITQPML